MTVLRWGLRRDLLGATRTLIRLQSRRLIPPPTMGYLGDQLSLNSQLSWDVPLQLPSTPYPKPLTTFLRRVLPQPLNTDLAQEQSCAKNRNHPFSCITNCSLCGREPKFSLSAPGQSVGQ